jgi:dsDNA-specific endonuclease/ATPase MutS2
MAKYEDYVKQDLEDEIDEAATATEDRREQVQIPERFKGKSAEEIARAYVELESLQGRQANEYGQLRKTFETLLELQNKTSEPAKPAPEKKPVTVDEIYENADGAVRRVVREESQSRIEELERKLQEAERRSQAAEARATFERKHPEWQKTVQDPTFIEWIKQSPYRVKQAQVADSGDFDAADELFSTYAELASVRATQTKQVRKTAVREAALESSGGASPTPVEKYSRSKLESVRVRARQGDPDAERYLAAHGDDILRAYSEGRIVN